MTPAIDAMSPHQRAHLAASSQARQQSWRARLALAAATAALSAVWVHWWALLWLGVIVVAEYVLTPWFRRQFVRRGGAEWPLMVWRVVMATLYSLSWAPALAIGGSSASIFAICMLAGALIHSLVYFSTTLSQFALSIGPPIVIASGVSLLFHGDSVWAWLILPALTIMVGRALLARSTQARMSRQLAEDQAMLEASEESSRAKTTFLTTMTHELRTPLNAIINFSEMMEEELRDSTRPQLAQDATRIHAAGLQLLTIVNASLDYALLEAGNLTLNAAPFDLAELVEGSAKRCGGDATIRLDLPKISIVSDPERVRQCCDNLIDNAVKFSQGKPLEVSYAIESSGGQDFVHVYFRDQGRGVPPDAADKIFEPMSQIDVTHTRLHGGAGMGLALTRKLARAMGGDCALVENEPGLGATFRLTLPLTHTARDHERRKA